MRESRNLTRPWRIGVDIGGTFTDVVIADAGGEFVVKKSPSIPRDPGASVLGALAAAAEISALSLRELLSGCAAFIHGSTIATNTVLEGKVARAGLLCTAGFRDALTIRRGIRADPWQHREPYPPPLVPRHLRLPVRGRIAANGTEIEPMVPGDVVAAMHRFAAAQVEAV